MKLQYVGPFDEVEVPALGIAVKRDEAIDVDDAIAGRAPKGEPTLDGKPNPDHDPGEGLLAQIANWRPAGARANARGSAEANDEEQAE